MINDLAKKIARMIKKHACKTVNGEMNFDTDKAVEIIREHMPLQFSFTPEEHKKIQVWEREQDALVKAKQKGIKFGNSEAYYGPIGGSCTYEFTITSVGVIKQVRHAVTGAVLDLTDYNDW